MGNALSNRACPTLDGATVASPSGSVNRKGNANKATCPPGVAGRMQHPAAPSLTLIQHPIRTRYSCVDTRQSCRSQREPRARCRRGARARWRPGGVPLRNAGADCAAFDPLPCRWFGRGDERHGSIGMCRRGRAPRAPRASRKRGRLEVRRSSGPDSSARPRASPAPARGAGARIVRVFGWGCIDWRGERWNAASESSAVMHHSISRVRDRTGAGTTAAFLVFGRQHDPHS